MNVSPGRSTSAPPDPGPAPWSYGLAPRISPNRVLRVFTSSFKIDHWSILGKGMSAYSDFLLDPAWFSLQNRSLVDFQERTKQNQAESSRIVTVSRCGSLWRGGGRKPAGIGFYLHKEFRAARIRFYRGTMRPKIAIFKKENSFCRGSKFFDGKLVAHRQFLVGTLVVLIF